MQVRGADGFLPEAAFCHRGRPPSEEAGSVAGPGKGFILSVFFLHYTIPGLY